MPDREIWSYGHRNPPGLGFNPLTGDLYANEHGPQGGDEVNVIRPGSLAEVRRAETGSARRRAVLVGLR